MDTFPSAATEPPSTGRSEGIRWSEVWPQVAAVVAFVALVVIGLYWVKWHPYYHKGFATATKHSLGASIVTGHSATAPKGWQAALDFAYKYTLSIWPALTVGLLVGAGIQELLPRDWLTRVLGPRRWQSTAIAGAAAVPSMM